MVDWCSSTIRKRESTDQSDGLQKVRQMYPSSITVSTDLGNVRKIKLPDNLG